MKCETIKKNHELCGKEAKYKVGLKTGGKGFLVCEDCIPAYKHIQMKEYGNTEGSFIVEVLK